MVVAMAMLMMQAGVGRVAPSAARVAIVVQGLARQSRLLLAAVVVGAAERDLALWVQQPGGVVALLVGPFVGHVCRG